MLHTHHHHCTAPPAPVQGDREVASVYFDDAVRCRTAKINDFFLKYLTREWWWWGGGELCGVEGSVVVGSAEED